MSRFGASRRRCVLFFVVHIGIRRRRFAAHIFPRFQLALGLRKIGITDAQLLDGFEVRLFRVAINFGRRGILLEALVAAMLAARPARVAMATERVVTQDGAKTVSYHTHLWRKKLILSTIIVASYLLSFIIVSDHLFFSLES